MLAKVLDQHETFIDCTNSTMSPSNAEINFCINFECYDLTNGLTSSPKIWFGIPTSA